MSETHSSMSTTKKMLIEQILSCLQPKDLATEVLISNNKNSLLRQFAKKYYHKFSNIGNMSPGLIIRNGEGSLVHKGRLYIGKFYDYFFSGKMLTGHNCVFEGEFVDYIPVRGKGKFYMDGKIISVNEFIKKQEHSVLIKGKIEEIKTGNIFEGSFYLLLNKQSLTIDSGNGIIHYKGMTIKGESFDQDNEINLRKVEVIDQLGNQLYLTLNEFLFPDSYSGSIAFNDYIYKGEFGSQHFEGTVTSINNKEIVFKGKCEREGGVPIKGSGSYLKKKCIYTGEWKEENKFEGTVSEGEGTFTGRCYKFRPEKGHGDFKWKGLLISGTVMEFNEVEGRIVSPFGHSFEGKFHRQGVTGKGAIQLGHFLYSGEWNKFRPYIQIFHKGRQIYEGHCLLSENIEGFLCMDDKIYHKKWIYSIADKIY